MRKGSLKKIILSSMLVIVILLIGFHSYNKYRIVQETLEYLQTEEHIKQDQIKKTKGYYDKFGYKAAITFKSQPKEIYFYTKINGKIEQNGQRTEP
ncbi:MAG: DUF3139 domain-containing protein [Bacillaceae bacterium]